MGERRYKIFCYRFLLVKDKDILIELLKVLKFGVLCGIL